MKVYLHDKKEYLKSSKCLLSPSISCGPDWKGRNLLHILPGAVSVGPPASWQVRHLLRPRISSPWSVGLVLWGWESLSGTEWSVWNWSFPSRLRAGGSTLPQWGSNSPHQPGGMTGICHAMQADPVGLEVPYLCSGFEQLVENESK